MSGDGADRPTSRALTTPDEIVTAALEIIDRAGIGALTMRRLSSELGVFPASLYWHVGNRSQLLGLVCERVLSQIELPSQDLPWRDWLFTFGLRTRQVIGSHPRFAAYFVSNIQTSQSSLDLAEHTMAALRRAGFAGHDLVRAYNAVIGAVFGWISGEFAASPEEKNGSARSAIESLVLDADRYPNLHDVWPFAANRAYMLRWDSGAESPLEPSFETMLTSLLDGLARSLEIARIAADVRNANPPR
ncbi:TetR/AcrR family transcriptional regulator C-terminal domain-containing protein [Microbacterium sp. Kw_RZR3]|uniref:TetR/AcrR family transcriptional regulator C-terminal domain-containing protein n=1 Tax=unclassified Microbacterium TaxID=2609290 RepID=UPI0023DB4308|nr:TetR/AcrR family transcriptional regulator C-terminal domain-containing protein [Microbacterium sp. Kw_RZR3]MDF2045332.1 TetR/AcrR family transcriptional regulator C-terminal domain-containing protein [Microbacterium sp. Kw_RZR3]